MGRRKDMFKIGWRCGIEHGYPRCLVTRYGGYSGSTIAWGIVLELLSRSRTQSAVGIVRIVASHQNPPKNFVVPVASRFACFIDKYGRSRKEREHERIS